MLKKIISVLAALALLFSAAAAEEDQPRLIGVQEGEEYLFQISSLEGDASVGILGVESDPLPRRWEDFDKTLTAYMKRNYDMDVAFSEVFWCGGQWMRVLDVDLSPMRVITTDETPDGLIREVLVNAYTAEFAYDVQVLTAAAYYAAAQCGQYGKYTLQLVSWEDHSEDWFTGEPANIWIENGFQLSFGLDEARMPCGRIVFTEELPTKAAYAPFDPDGMRGILPERSVEELMERLRESAEMGPLSDYITAPVLPDEWENVQEGRMYSVEWDDCVLLLYTDSEGQTLHSAALAPMSGDTVSACLHLFPLYDAVVYPDTEETALLSCITGGHGTWEEMCALEPFCVMDGVLLQCDMQEIGGNPVPIAFLCGAEEINEK